MKIGNKILLGFSAVIFLFALSTAWANYQLRQLRLLEHENASITANSAALKSVLLGMERSSARMSQAAVLKGADETAREIAAIKARSEKDFPMVGALPASGRESAWPAQYQARWREYLEAAERQLLPALEQNDRAEILRIAGFLTRLREQASEPLASFDEALAQRQAQAREAYAAIIKNTTLIMGIIFICDLLGSLCIAWLLRRAIQNPLADALAMAQEISRGNLDATMTAQQDNEVGMLADAMRTMTGNLKGLVRLAEKISRGDLTVQVKPLSDQDVLGISLRDMVAKLSGTMSEIRSTAAHVLAGATQMSATSQSLSQGATEQASSIQEISSSMQEIASQTRQNAENASQADRLARETKISAEQGNAQMAEMFVAMRDMKDSGVNISRIIKVIDEIAFQTNLLALNAAVEAARAGKYGKGFAVVAEEVRNLAARSAKAARETADLIEDSVRKVDAGSEKAEKTAMALYSIFSAAEKMTDLVSEIAAGSNEQAQGVSQITTGLGQVDQITHMTTAHAEQCAAAAEELTSQAGALQQLVSVFRLSDLPAGPSRPEPEDSAGQWALGPGQGLDN